ncbi:sel1 repeat family protein [Tropicibacter sp. R15_0]|uniref:sel1 repeat family protein n=1 Tax=Tropicibacter sp. R15_0 TaxID=2821101 RepID=UPI001ADB0705|nr:sel1 repeat family protein [Tropicibacter sp. R15_0]MBO9464362.1 sel1 repeat family protein [Tropicibacter sp. R15_0]
MLPEDLWPYLITHFKTGAAVSSFFIGATALGFSLLHPDRKSSIALWLLGARGSEENWARSFCSIFDGIFGERHVSLRCFLASALFSLATVFGLWLLFGTNETIRTRMDSVQDLGRALAIAAILNVLTDYISLFQTRWLLDLVTRTRSSLVHLFALLLDLILTTAIILLALWLFQLSPLYNLLTEIPLETSDGEVTLSQIRDGETLGEVILLYTPFSVFFYSTFLTSVWLWIYTAATHLMRLLAFLRLGRVFDVEGAPVKLLLTAMSFSIILVVSGGSTLASALLAPTSSGLSVAENMICKVTLDQSCFRVALLDKNDITGFKRILAHCDTEAQQCAGSLDGYIQHFSEIAVEVGAEQCDENSPTGCFAYGYAFEFGLGGAPNMSDAVDGYSSACLAGSPMGCGITVSAGLSIGLKAASPDITADIANDCEDVATYAGNCLSAKILAGQSDGLAISQSEADSLFATGCQPTSSGSGCAFLEKLSNEELNQHIVMDTANSLYNRSCEMGVFDC